MKVMSMYDAIWDSTFHCYTSAHPLNCLDATTTVEPYHNGPKGVWKQPHEILFKVTLALYSGQKQNEQCASQSKAEAIIFNLNLGGLVFYCVLDHQSDWSGKNPSPQAPIYSGVGILVKMLNWQFCRMKLKRRPAVSIQTFSAIPKLIGRLPYLIFCFDPLSEDFLITVTVFLVKWELSGIKTNYSPDIGSFATIDTSKFIFGYLSIRSCGNISFTLGSIADISPVAIQFAQVTLDAWPVISIS